jgi:UDP-N-acetylmuramyl pentapeptide phosphotransferase/UDP-N-acetylglucosamine-1-phosphate transferase
MKHLYIFLLPIIIYLINSLLKKKSLLMNYSGEIHQKFTIKENIPLSGGILILSSFYLYFYDYSDVFNLHLFLIFLLGLSADLKIIKSAQKRFIFQIIILYLFIDFMDMSIIDTRILYLDKLLTDPIFNNLFVLFCVLIVVNGTNFIDGLNTNVLGYYIIVSLILYKINFFYILDLSSSQWVGWIMCLVIFYFFNLFKLLFIGDNGAYVLGLIYSYLLIHFYNIDQNISPFFIILLLWYPCFEILFSIIRKFKLNKSPIKPDNNHFHQLIFLYFKDSLKLKTLISNNLGANVINLYNFIILYIGSLSVRDTQFQIILIILNVLVYVFVYIKLYKKSIKKIIL